MSTTDRPGPRSGSAPCPRPPTGRTTTAQPPQASRTVAGAAARVLAALRQGAPLTTATLLLKSGQVPSAEGPGRWLGCRPPSLGQGGGSACAAGIGRTLESPRSSRALEAVGGRPPRAAWRGEPQLVECGLQRMALSMPPTRRGSEALPIGGVTRSQQTPQDPRDLTLRTSGAQWWLRLAVAPPRLRAPTPEGPRPTFHSAWPCSCHERDQGHQDPRPPPNPAGRVDCLGLTLKSCGHPGPGGAGRTGRRGQRSGRSPLVCSHRCSIKRGNRTSLWTNPAPPPCSRESPLGTWTAGRRVQHCRSAISGAVERLAWGPNDGPPDRLWGKHRAPGGWRCTARSPKLTVGSLWHAGLL